MSLFLIALRHLLEVPSAIVEIGYSVLLAPLLYLGLWMVLPGGKQKLAEHFSHFRLALDEITSRVWSAASPTASGS
jgi:hypothetical protein